MKDLEEALRNIDVFLRTLVKKIVEYENCSQNIAVEPVENLLRRKYIIEESLESKPSKRYLIPIPQAEEPLIDVFEDENYVKIFLQCRCKDQEVTIHTDVDGLEICTKECLKLNLSVGHLQVENMIARCNNNTVFEIDIPKAITTISYGN
ncbi:MAG: hypothetical protein OEZ21_09930 [Candidatus Bathyarchaeota archaeon]|nr:hypothetical protein [Candidatus Bathyarchaeota archaeon]MDH5747245.1 hypothetical protein [Candidatus Bathyarchaeota archaeon]